MRRTPQLAVCAAALLVLTLGACSDGSSDGATSDPTTAPSSASSPSDPASPTGTTEPSVAAASGPVLTTDSATVNLPDGWRDNKNGLPYTYSGSPRDGSGIQLITVVDLTNSNPADSVAELGEKAMKALGGAKLEVQPSVELDGAEAYHFSGRVPVQGPYEEVGTYSHGRSLSISFTLNGYSPAERREIVDSVVASFRWTS